MSTEPKTREEEIDDAWTDVRAAPDAVHRVEWTLELRNLYGKVVCDGGAHSPCRAYCPDGCEVNPCAHLPKYGQECGIIPFFDDVVQEYYVGDETAPRNGPIELIWDGDCYDWKYAAESASGGVL